MAKSYFGYVERDQEAFVNWASIGTQISKDLEKIRVNRQEQRDELDRVTNEAVTTINDLTANQPKLVSEFYMDGANDMRQYLLMLNKEMKAGRLAPSEYMKKKQVLMDGVTQLGDAAKAFATDYEESMKLMQEGKSAGQKIFQDEQYDAFKSTDGKGIYVNPADGRVYIAKRNPDGTINNNPEDLLSVNKLYARRKDIVYKYDVIGEANKNVKVLGDIVKAKRSGNVLTLKDVMQNPEYLKAEGDIINSMMSSPRNVGSILSDYVGGYSFTLKPEEAKGDPNKILLTEDGMGLYMPQLTDAQRKKAEEALRAQLRVQLDEVEAPMPVFAPDRNFEFGIGQKKKQNADNIELLRKVYVGDKEAEIALDAIRAANPNILKINREKENVIITFNDGRIERLPIPKEGSGASSGFEQFVSRAGGFLLNIEPQQAFVDYRQSDYFGRPTQFGEAEFARGTELSTEGNAKLIADKIGAETFKLEEEDAVPIIQAQLPSGFTAEESEWGYNKVKVTAPNGKSIKIKLAREDDAEAGLRALQAFLVANGEVSLPEDAESITTTQYNKPKPNK
jgi:hypothetical protein